MHSQTPRLKLESSVSTNLPVAVTRSPHSNRHLSRTHPDCENFYRWHFHACRLSQIVIQFSAGGPFHVNPSSRHARHPLSNAFTIFPRRPLLCPAILRQSRHL